MATMAVSETKLPSLPASEREFIQSLLALRYRHRASFIQSLIQTHGEALIPLIKNLLATEPAITSIPIPRPPKKDVELNADGGNPEPEFDIVPLHICQTNASSRYLQRTSGCTMAIMLAQKGNQSATAILLANLNHPYQVGKKQLIQCLATCASDEDLLNAAKVSAPSVRDALVDALSKKKRKDLARSILGKPRKDIHMAELQLPFSTRFRRALEQAKEYDREKVWDKFSDLVDIRNQPPKNLCEEGESIKDVVLTLQETFPPLHPWDSALPEQRSPKLASLTEKNLVTLLSHDTERTIRILQRTSWQMHADNVYSFHIPTAMHDNKQASRFWRHKGNVAMLLQEYWLGLMAVGDGAVVKEGRLPHWYLFDFCRGHVVYALVRAALALLDGDEFKTTTQVPEQINIRRQHISNILYVAVSGMKVLIYRHARCSAIKERDGFATYFRDILYELMTHLIVKATEGMRTHTKDDAQFIKRLYQDILDPLAHRRYSWPGLLNVIPLMTFPPLGQHLYQLIKVNIKPKLRKDTTVISTIEDIMHVLAPRDMSVYALPNNTVEQPYSSVPAWNNNSVYQSEVADYMKQEGKAAIQLDSVWLNHLCKLAPYLTPTQRDDIVRWISTNPNFKDLVNMQQGIGTFRILKTLCTNVALRHKLVFPLVFYDKKEKEVDLGENITDWAAYVDIRIPDVRALMIKETIKPASEDRLNWLKALLKATRLTGDVKEWIITLKWLLPKIRNEIHPNLTSLAPCLYDDQGQIPRQYIHKATLEQARELSKLYLTMDAQNTAAVTPVHAISRFIEDVAGAGFARFINDPSHPFYQLGVEIPWRRALMQHGELTALEHYDCAGRITMWRYLEEGYFDAPTERDEETELFRRQMVAKAKDAKEKEGGPWGLYRVPVGDEEAYVQGMVRNLLSRWLSVKATMDPDVEGDDIRAFKAARGDIWRLLCTDLARSLGWRWKNSPTLVGYLDEVLDMLAGAPTKTFGPDVVLSWSLTEKKYNSYYFITSVIKIYSNHDWMITNRAKLPWLKRFKELRLKSTESEVEIEDRLQECKLKNGKQDQVRYEELMQELLNTSPSAIHHQSVEEFVTSRRPEMLTDEHLSMTKGIVGVFNQVETAESWNIFVRKPAQLSPHQCQLLKTRHLVGMVDAAIPFDIRVEHAHAFISLPTTTVEDIAKALCTPSLPSRIIEALLMYLPTLSEPSSTLQLLLTPAHIQSHLARTSIYAVENALKYVPLNQVPDFILPLFPPKEERQQKITVQKEGVRLACANMQLLADSRVRGLVEDLIVRTDLNTDVHVTILQSLLRQLSGPEGREERYIDITQWIWRCLAQTANSTDLKKSGVVYALMATTPSYKARRANHVSTSTLDRTMITSATLNSLAKVQIPEALVDRYVNEILLPLCEEPTGEDEGDEDMILVRNLTLQLLAQGRGWITTTNAARFAKAWREDAIKVPGDNDKNQLWKLFAIGIANCVGREVDGAMHSGQEGCVAWQELIGFVQDQVDMFLDKTRSRLERLMAHDRLVSLNLESNFMLEGFDQAKATGAFKGNDLDLCRPLMNKAIEAATWTIALQREITVFKPSDSMTQTQINEEGLRILLRIADFSNRYLTDGHNVRTWVWQRLMVKSEKGSQLQAFLGRAVLEPHSELLDWVHLEDVGLSILENIKGVFSQEEVSTFIEKLATQEDQTFYRSERTRIYSIIQHEVDRIFTDKKGDLGAVLPHLTKLLTPFVTRAKAAGWIKGPDAIIFTGIMHNRLTSVAAAFPDLIGPWLHSQVSNCVDMCAQNTLWSERVIDFVNFGSVSICLGRKPSEQPVVDHSDYGLTCTETLIMERLLNGNSLDALDLTAFLSPHELPLEIMYGQWYRFNGNPEAANAVTQHPQTLQDVEARWNKTVADYSDFFKPLEQGMTKSMSSNIIAAYRFYAIKALDKKPIFALVRPFVYLEFVRLVLTAPGATKILTTEMVAKQLVTAFTPVKDRSGDEFTYAWAPPLGLALDLAEYLLHDMRDEVASEGQREAQLIEQLTAFFLAKWMASVVEKPVGKLLAEAEDTEALKKRYLALVEELCEEGSGGQSSALRLPEFLPGGTAAEKPVEDYYDEAEDMYSENDYDEDMGGTW
ncbi:hypothetical protein BGZ51_002148 [Haplosporangium sp. Z 767]|nr:hypothetical protein BGZ51_002148 [Haplosporangium sp. Z 767]KAF9195203.1 hypothetical protein BGZ50_005037 [Haplosporangium sp. Z 11]